MAFVWERFAAVAASLLSDREQTRYCCCDVAKLSRQILASAKPTMEGSGCTFPPAGVVVNSSAEVVPEPAL